MNNSIFLCTFAHSKNAEVAQLVEHDLAKVGVAGSSLVFCSEKKGLSKVLDPFLLYAVVVELVDTQDLKSCEHNVHAGSTPARGTNLDFKGTTWVQQISHL